MTTKRRTWKSKNRVTFWLENDLLGEIKSEAKTRRISQQSIFEATLKDRYSVESREESEALIARRLNRIDNHIRAKQRLSEVHAEALALFIRMWLSSTPEIPEEQRNAAVLKGKARYDRYLSSLASRVSVGESIFTDLPKELFLRSEDFLK